VAASNNTLAVWTPKDATVPFGGQAPLVKINSGVFLAFGPNAVAPDAKVPEYVEFMAVLPRSSVNGYTGTTGIKVVITWASRNKVTTGNVVWGAELLNVGATDLPDPTVDLWNTSSYEVTGTSGANSSTAGGLVQVTINVTVANIKHGQTTNPAAGDVVRGRIRRILSNASDTMTGDAIVQTVELYDY